MDTIIGQWATGSWMLAVGTFVLLRTGRAGQVFVQQSCAEPCLRILKRACPGVVLLCPAGPYPHWLAKCYPALEELDLSNNRVSHA
jgi:hypothetical protein